MIYRWIALLVLVTSACSGSAPTSSTDTAPVEPEPTATTEANVEPTSEPATAAEATAETTSEPSRPTAQPDPRPATEALAGHRIEVPQEIGGLEGIAVDPATGRVFVGDLTTGIVWAGTNEINSFVPFASAVGRTSAIGLAVDPALSRLYVATGGGDRLDIHDLGNGELISSVEFDSPPGALINDVTVAPDGTAFITDSGIGRLHALNPTDDTTTVLIDAATIDSIGAVPGPLHFNGVIADDTVVVAVHMAERSLYRVDRATGDIQTVELSGVDGPGVDGMLLCGDRLYSVTIGFFNGGVTAVRVIDLSADRSSGTFVEDITDPSLSSPATLAAIGDELLVTNAQFGITPVVTPFWLTALPATC